MSNSAENDPVVSVVMSVHNGERFLREAVESILGQSFRDFEFITIDDGSTDCTAAILSSYQRNDPRVRVYHQENRGLIESLNRGCGVARGKYIARMDADDVAVRDRLMRQVDFMETHREIAVLGGAVEVINAAGESLATYRNPAKDDEIKSELLQGGCPLWHPAVLMRSHVFRSVGGYRRNVVDAEDLDLWLRIADHYQLGNLEAIVLRYRRHDAQVSVRKFKQQVFSNLAARIATSARRSGKPDPLDAVGKITPTVLAALGATDARQQAALAKGYLICIRSMYEAREYAIARTLVSEARRSAIWDHADNPVTADFYLIAARLYWQQRRLITSIVMLSQAMVTRPRVLARRLKPIVGRIRFWIGQI